MPQKWKMMSKPDATSIAIAGLFIALVGAYIYWRQLDAMQRQLAALEVQVDLERPWVGPVGPTPLSFDKTTKRLVGMEWKFQNGGRSPSLHEREYVRFVIGPSAKDATEKNFPKLAVCSDPPDKMEGGNMMIPGTPPPVVILNMSQEVKAAMDDVYAERKGLFIAGCIYYTDSAMQKWYKTDVTEIFIPNYGLGSFEMFKWGNDAR